MLMSCQGKAKQLFVVQVAVAVDLTLISELPLSSHSAV